MKSRIAVLLLTAVLLVSLAAVASAVEIPATSGELGVMDFLPEVPSMTTKNDGTTQTVTMSEPVDWLAAIWNWQWNEMTFTDESHTSATVDMAGHGNAAQGYGIWVSANLDSEGNVTWAGTGTYEMEYAYDCMTRDGVNVKYGTFGQLVLITVNKAGTEYFGNGASSNTSIVYARSINSAGKPVVYAREIKEEYPDGSYIHGRFGMNGQMTYAYQIGADGKHTVLFSKAPAAEPAKDPEEAPGEGSDEEDLVIFEGSQKLNGQGDWNDGWIDRTDSLGLAGNAKMDQFVSGTSLKITWEFPYESWKDADWSNGPMVVIQPTDNWAWAQAQSDASSKADGVTVFSFDSLAGINNLGGPTSDRDYKYFGIYPLGTEVTITKVEIVK